jgi:hypothetical protein
MRGRPKGSKNKPKVPGAEATAAAPKAVVPPPPKFTDKDFDQLKTAEKKRTRYWQKKRENFSRFAFLSPDTDPCRLFIIKEKHGQKKNGIIVMHCTLQTTMFVYFIKSNANKWSSEESKRIMICITDW